MKKPRDCVVGGPGVFNMRRTMCKLSKGRDSNTNVDKGGALDANILERSDKTYVVCTDLKWIEQKFEINVWKNDTYKT